MIFNEGVLYKDRGTSFKAKKHELISLKDLPKVEDANSRRDLPEVEDKNSGSEDQENVAPKETNTTPVVELRRASRTIRSPQRYSPALHYILLTDRGEPESCDEAI